MHTFSSLDEDRLSRATLTHPLLILRPNNCTPKPFLSRVHPRPYNRISQTPTVITGSADLLTAIPPSNRGTSASKSHSVVRVNANLAQYWNYGMPVIKVSNVRNGDSLSYSLALLCGEVTAGEGVTQGSLLAYNTLDQSTQVWPLHRGAFKLVIQLYPGENTIVLQTTQDTLDFHLTYRLQDNLCRFVRPLYIVCQDDEGDFQAPEDVACSPESAVQRITLGTRLLQTFTAEKLHEHGLGRKTFSLECEVDPRMPPCHVYRTKLTLKQAYEMSGGELWMYFAKELMSCPQFEHKDNCKWFAFMSFTRYCPPLGMPPKSHSEVLQYTKGHTALGGGGLALFGTGTLHTWAPSLEELQCHLTDTRKIDRERFMDDSAYRECHWANYSTSLGASLHELGHTFDLAHTPTGIMARGFDDLYRVFAVQPLAGGGSEGTSDCASVDISRTASPVPYSPRESPRHTNRKRVNSLSDSASECISPAPQTNFNSLPRTRSRSNSGCSTKQTSCDKETFQIEAEFKKLTVQTTHSFTTKNYDGSETKKMVTKYRDGMETVAEITKQPGGEMVVKEVIKNLNSGKSRTVLSMTSVKTTASKDTEIPSKLTHTPQSNTNLTQRTTHSQQDGITTLTHITTVSNGIPLPAKADPTPQNDTESSDSDANSVNNVNTSNNSNCAITSSRITTGQNRNSSRITTTVQNQNSSQITTSAPQAVASTRKREGIHQFRPRRKDGGAHWYRSSAIILAHHKWFNTVDVTGDGKPPEIQGNQISSQCGLCVIELRSLPEGVVLHHWEFLNPDPGLGPPTSQAPPTGNSLTSPISQATPNDNGLTPPTGQAPPLEEAMAPRATTQFRLQYSKVREFVSSAVGHFTVLVMDRHGHVLKRKMTLHDLCA